MSEEKQSMYVVHYHHNKGLRMGSGDIRKPGENVPEAEKWKDNVLMANLRLLRIQTVSEYTMAKEISERNKEIGHEKKPVKNNAIVTHNKSAQDIKNEKEDADAAGESETADGEDSNAPNVNNNVEGSEILKALMGTKVKELRKLAKQYGVAQKGKQEELAKRIHTKILESKEAS